MKILLIGEYSNVHNTLARGLRELGHEVCVVSNGDFWKNYPRDIDVSRTPGKLGGMALMLKLWTLLPRMTGYDVGRLEWIGIGLTPALIRNHSGIAISISGLRYAQIPRL